MRSTRTAAAMLCRFRTTPAVLLAFAMLAFHAGCASTARVADDEWQIADLQRHVIQIEASLDDDDDSDDVDAAKVVSTTRPSHESARDALARCDARRAAHLANLTHADVPGFRARGIDAKGHAIVTTLDMASGPMANTGRQLDLAINGNGFLRVKTRDGVAYTRCGNLFVNANRLLVIGSLAGPQVDPPLSLPPETTDVTIANDGTIEVTKSGAVAPTQIGRLELVRFVDPQHLAPVDDVLFAETPASGPAILGAPGDAGFGTIEQNFLEGSNVSADVERAELHGMDVRRDHLLRLVSFGR